jgi:hypothetical protein
MKRIVPYIPLIILILALCYTLINVSTTNRILGTKQFIAIWLVLGCLVITYLNRLAGLFATGLVLILGTINIISFQPYSETINLGFGVNAIGLDYTFQPLSFGVLILFLIINFKRLRLSLQSLFSGNSINKADP